MKKISLILLSIIIFTSLSFADEHDITEYQVEVIVDGETMNTYDEEQDLDTPAFIYNGRTMLPLKNTFELFDIDVSDIKWNGEERSVTVTTREYDTIYLQIDSDVLLFNGREVSTDVPAKIFNSRTFIPVAIISSLLGEEPVWNGELRTVTMNPKLNLLDEFGMSFDLAREYGFSKVHLYDTGKYRITRNVDNDMSKMTIMDFLMYDGDIYEALKYYANEMMLSTEDFRILVNDNKSFYYIKDELNTFAIIGVGSKTLIVESYKNNLELLEEINKHVKESN